MFVIDTIQILHCSIKSSNSVITRYQCKWVNEESRQKLNRGFDNPGVSCPRVLPLSLCNHQRCSPDHQVIFPEFYLSTIPIPVASYLSTRTRVTVPICSYHERSVVNEKYTWHRESNPGRLGCWKREKILQRNP